MAEVAAYRHRLRIDTTSCRMVALGELTSSHNAVPRTGRADPGYGHEPGALFYTHVSDQYAPFYSQVINATARDATYVLDGLLYHETDRQIEEHYTDTAGFSDHVPRTLSSPRISLRTTYP